MLQMVLLMTGATALYVLLTVVLWKVTHQKPLNWTYKVLIGLLYGAASVVSTHVGIDYNGTILNVRDLGPLTAGLFFDPFSGILAGLIGGVERYIAGLHGVGSVTRFACSVSTGLAGFVAAGLRIWVLKNKKPSAVFAFILGAVMEVFHMYVVLITHRNDMNLAMEIVRTCSGPMILFTGIGMSASSIVLRVLSKEWVNPLRWMPKDEVPLSHKFQLWLFIVTSGILVFNLVFTFLVQTRTSLQSARETLTTAAADIRSSFAESPAEPREDAPLIHVGQSGSFEIIENKVSVTAGAHQDQAVRQHDLLQIDRAAEGEYFTSEIFGEESLCLVEKLDDSHSLLVRLPVLEIYASRNDQMLEIAFADILMFAVIYTLIYLLVQQIVVKNLCLVNVSLSRITGGHLDEVVNVRGSSEFSSLSDDINLTVDTLKGYISAAEKRFEQELEFARTIQDSSLPKNFTFPRHDFEIFAIMDPAREVGGDFYDFFFVNQDKLVLVIADVSGKGIPAALFMMRAKASIRSLAESVPEPAEILFRANNVLCEGNDAEMFVTVWLGIIDLKTGQMRCANAGHEYPALMRSGGDFELLKDKHGLALAAMDQMRYREYTLEFSPGDRLFVYTDGVPEAIDPDETAYGTERMICKLNSVKPESLEKMLNAVHSDLLQFQGSSDQFDDITMLGFTYLGPEARGQEE